MKWMCRCLVGLIFGLTGLAGCQQNRVDPESNPNIVIILADDMGYGDLSCYNPEGIFTPNLDQLAREGLRLTDFYVPATVCTPSRAGLMTGKYPKRVGLHEAVLYPYSEHGLSPEEYTLGEMFRDAGYATYCIGKWHLGHQEVFMPNNQGFDYFYGVPYSNDMNNHYYRHNDFQSPPLPIYRNELVIERDPHQKYLTRKFTSEAIQIIETSGDSPFFIYLPHVMPHTPLHVSEEFEGRSEHGLYGDVITELDWSVGEIVKALKQEGKFENTILVFTSDNGPVPQAGGSAGPLRGRKSQTWEGGQRVPCIVSWPNGIPGNTVSSEMVSTLDLFPTFAQIIGVELPAEHILDGRDVTSLLENPQEAQLAPHDFYFYSRNGNLEAVRFGSWKLHTGKETSKDLYKANGDFPTLLFDLATDIGEQKDVSNQNPKVVSKLKEMMESFDLEKNKTPK